MSCMIKSYVVAAVLVQGLVNSAFLGAENMSVKKAPQKIAHRGYSARYPENTRAAFRAVGSKADMVEFDVYFSRDKEIVVVHDESLERLAGTAQRVQDLSYEELKRLDVGSSFDKKFSGEHIPTLREVFELFKGGIAINVEIKELEGGQVQQGLEEAVIKLVKEMGMHEQVLISSFNSRCLARARELDPSIKIALNIEYGTDGVSEKTDMLKHVQALKPDAVHCDKEFLTKELVERLHAAGFLVGVFTVKSQEELERFTAFGVDRMFINHLEGFGPAQ
jgi:glycerophosphoryl diester phosphodiesterase